MKKFVVLLLLIITILVFIYIGSGILGTSQKASHEFEHITNVYIWTRQSPVVSKEVVFSAEGSSLCQTHFSPYRPTYVITHGFLSSALYNWVTTLKDALLSRLDCNVLAISWQSGLSRLSYYAVQGRVPAVGAEVAVVLRHLLLEGLNSDMVHLLGHSLGAHVAGFAGKHFNGSLGRITGLDPAGMGFNGAAPEERLDRSDARFVDVIHTHACTTLIQTYTCYGITSSIGDVDVWVNGGQEQPACGKDGDGEQLLEDGSPCSHSMAYVYYTESLEYPPSSKYYLARSCPSSEHYSNNSCTCAPHPQYMGFNVNQRTMGDFYVSTKNTWPYGVADSDCPASEYTALQLFGVSVLTLSLACLVVICFILVWLHRHPEDREFFTKEFLWTFIAASVEEYLTRLEAFREEKRDGAKEETD